ncbi:MAG: hypothetical protein ABI473_09590 [Candidatus Dormibacter sp.]
MTGAAKAAGVGAGGGAGVATVVGAGVDERAAAVGAIAGLLPHAAAARAAQRRRALRGDGVVRMREERFTGVAAPL